MAFFDLRRINIQDFEKKYQDLIGKLAPIINNSFESISNSFNNGITVKDNLAAQQIDLTVTAPVIESNPVYFKSTLRGQCSTIFVGSCTSNKNAAPPTGYPFLTWQNSNGQIKITNITNLTDGGSYTLRLICYL